MTFAGSNVSRLWNHGVSAARRSSCGTSFPALAGHNRALNLLLQRHLLVALFRCELHLIERTLLLLEHQLGAGRRGPGDRGHCADALLARRRQQRHPRALAVADHRDALRIDVLALQQPPHDRADVFGVVLNRRRLGASAALSEATLVVAHGEEAGVGDRARQLRECRDAHARIRRDRRCPIRTAG